MENKDLVEIVNLCMKMEQRASSFYLSTSNEYDELSSTLINLHNQELEHIGHWESIKKIEEFENVITIDNYENTIEELNELNLKSEEALELYKLNPSIKNALLTTYRLEMMLIHPELLRLLTLNFDSSNSIQNQYEHHVETLLKLFNFNNENSLEMNILKDTTRLIWQREKKLIRLGDIDYLTKALNRRGFYKMVLPLEYIAKRHKSTSALIMIDVDNFKKVNDVYGHDKGDELLIDVTNIIKNNIRHSDILGRMGGDEFVIYLPEVKKNTSLDIAKKIQKRVKEKIKYPISLSIGVTERLANEESDIDELIKDADVRMYAAKNTGKDKIIN